MRNLERFTDEFLQLIFLARNNFSVSNEKQNSNALHCMLSLQYVIIKLIFSLQLITMKTAIQTKKKIREKHLHI